MLFAAAVTCSVLKVGRVFVVLAAAAEGKMLAVKTILVLLPGDTIPPAAAIFLTAGCSVCWPRLDEEDG